MWLVNEKFKRINRALHNNPVLFTRIRCGDAQRSTTKCNWKYKSFIYNCFSTSPPLLDTTILQKKENKCFGYTIPTIALHAKTKKWKGHYQLSRTSSKLQSHVKFIHIWSVNRLAFVSCQIIWVVWDHYFSLWWIRWWWLLFTLLLPTH